MTIKIPGWLIWVPVFALFLYFTVGLSAYGVKHKHTKWREIRQCNQCDTEVSKFYDVCPECGIGGFYQRSMVKRTVYTQPWYRCLFDSGKDELKPLEKR
jgi:hypothetical protein